MKRDAPVAAMRIAVPVASEVKKRRKTIFFGRIVLRFSCHLTTCNQQYIIIGKDDDADKSNTY